MPVVKIGMDVRGLKSGAAQAASTLEGVSSSADAARRNTEKLAASISKLAVHVVSLVGAYKALDTIKFFAQRGVEFNKTTEKTQVAIGSMVASMIQLENEQGKLLTGAEKYAAAQSIASDMMQEIQRLALSSTVPVEQLVAGMQDITDTALRAGVRLKEIPRFTVAAAQAMQDMQAPVTQMRSEMDALLTGKVSKSKGLAQILEIDQKTADSWKKQGAYIDNVLERFKKYQSESGSAVQTLEGATSRLKSSINIIAGQVTGGLNDSLKESIQNLQSLFVTSENGTDRISDDFANVAAVIERAQSAIGDTILSLTNTFAAAVRGLNEAIGNGAVTDTFDSVKTAVFTLTAALASLKVIRSATIAQTKQAIASEIQYAQAVSAGRAVVLGSAEARRQQAAATVEAAKAENEAAQAALVEARAQVRSANAKVLTTTGAKKLEAATRAQEKAQIGLINAEERAKITSDALTAAQGRLDVATKRAEAALTRKGRALAALIGTANRAKAAIGSLWAAMGGGVGVALTAIITGLTYLSTRQTDAERSTKLLEEAQDAYTRATKDAVDGTGKLTRELTALERKQIEMAQRKLLPDYDKQIQTIADSLNAAIRDLDLEQFIIDSGIEDIAETFKDAVPTEFATQLDYFINQLKVGKMAPKEFAENLTKMADALSKNYGNSELLRAIENLIGGEEQAINRLIKTREQIEKNKEILDSQAKAVKEIAKASVEYADALDMVDKAQSTEINGAKEAVEWLLKRTQNTESMTAVTEENSRAKDKAAMSELALAEAMAQLSYSAAVAQAAMADNTEEANRAVAAAESNLERIRKFREQAQKGLEDVYAGRTGKGGKSGGSGGASQIDSARESIKRLQEEIGRLNGTMSKEGGALAKKVAEIEKLGKQAKMSASEIQKLQEDYSAAFRADTLKEFDKAVLQIEGNAQALRQLEIAQTMKDWGLRFADLGMNADEAAPYLERLKAALETQESYKDLQTAADFYKDLESLSGEYGQSIEYQNQLIEKQAELWIQAGIPLADVEKRVQLMRQDLSRDMFSGLIRGARKFGAEMGDMAKQTEQLVSNMGNHFANTLADAFMKGKFSAQDFFNSLISMAAQAASNVFIGKIFSGIGGMVGGLFGAPTSGFSGTANNFSSNASFVGPMIPSGVYHAGGVVQEVSPSQRAIPYAAFINAPRFHNGGGYFSSDEFPAVLLRGERVLNRREAQAYNAGQASINPTSSINQDVTVNVINQTSQNVEAQTQTRQDANGGLSLDIILKQVDSGMAGLARQGKSQFVAFMQKAYGLDRAGTIMQGRGRA